jgi:hypothetical protein
MPAQTDKPGVLDDALVPFSIGFRVKGVKHFFFNAPNVDAYVRGEGIRAAGVKTRRHNEINFEEKVWRNGDALAVPGNEFIKAMKEMARALPDPTKSGLRSMRPLIPTAMSTHEEFSVFTKQNGKGPVSVETWDAIDERLGKLGTKMGPIRRPILWAGWETEVRIDCVMPETFSPADVVTLFTRGGLRGIGDATVIGYGRYVVTRVDEPTEIAWT